MRNKCERLKSNRYATDSAGEKSQAVSWPSFANAGPSHQVIQVCN